MTPTPKHGALLPVLLSVLLLSCGTHQTTPRGLVAPEGALADADSKLSMLRPILRGYPPDVTSREQRRKVERQWKETEVDLRELAAANPDDAAIQWRLGELYRFGHNLDVPDAGAGCITHLERAIALRPDYAEAYLELGIFYTDAGMRWAPLGEINLKKAIELSAPAPLPRGWRALTFAYYYQGRFVDAVGAADEYLSLVPDDSDLRQVKSLAEKAASRGATGFAPVGRVVIP